MQDAQFIVQLPDVEVKVDPSNKCPNGERTLREIAKEIRGDWKKVHFAAQPYLDAMSVMRSIDDRYGLEEGVFVVLYFLSNAAGWRGEVAKRVKKELNDQVKAHNSRKRNG